MENDDIIEVERQRQELMKKIQEKERLLDLIKSSHVKGDLKEIKEFQNKYNLRIKNQKEEEAQKPEIKEHEIPQEENIELNDEDLVKKTLFALKFQKAYRRYILNKKKNSLRHYYLNKLIAEFYKPISLERGAELRKIMIQKLKQLKIDEKDMKDVVEQYFKEYKDFCFSFPEKEKLREDNFFTYYQCIDLLDYMENLDPQNALEKGTQFKQFMLDKNKEFATKMKIDEMEKQFRSKNDVYQYTVIDDFEENQLLDDIDNRYNFENRNDIINKKP